MTTDRPPLEEFLCRRVHDYEWRKPITGSTHSGQPRQNPCTECNASAALVVEWLASAVTGGVVLKEAAS